MKIPKIDLSNIKIGVIGGSNKIQKIHIKEFIEDKLSGKLYYNSGINFKNIEKIANSDLIYLIVEAMEHPPEYKLKKCLQVRNNKIRNNIIEQQKKSDLYSKYIMEITPLLIKPYHINGSLSMFKNTISKINTQNLRKIIYKRNLQQSNPWSFKNWN